MLGLDSIFIEASWYPILSESLTKIKNNQDLDIKLRSVARECIRIFELHVRFFVVGQKAQVVLTPSQKKLLAGIAEQEGLPKAYERFVGYTIGEFERFGQSRKKV